METSKKIVSLELKLIEQVHMLSELMEMLTLRLLSLEARLDNLDKKKSFPEHFLDSRNYFLEKHRNHKNRDSEITQNNTNFRQKKQFKSSKKNSQRGTLKTIDSTALKEPSNQLIYQLEIQGENSFY